MAKKQSRKINKQPCKNHPDRSTSRKCYQCKDFICSECIIRYDHHLFCSDDCIQSYKHKQAGKKKKPSQSPPPPKPRYSVFPSKDIFYISLILFIIIVFWTRFYFPLKKQMEKLTKTAPTTQTLETFPWSPAIFQDNITLKLEPPLPDSIIANVWLNGTFYKTMQADSQIRFSVNLIKPGENECKIVAVLPNGSSRVIRKVFSSNIPRLGRLDFVRLPRNKKIIALTFDAGSKDGAIDSIISILNQYDVPATAFLTGEFIRRFPDRIQQLIKSERFIFGNHSYSHPHLTSYAKNQRHETLPGLNFRKLNHELTKTDSLFYAVSSHHLKRIWRAPYGEYNKEILNWSGHLGYVHIGWSRGFDTFDWVADTTSSIYYTPQQLWEKWHRRYEKEPGRFNGAIVLMHLGNDRVKPMYTFLHQFIPFMKAHGYSFVNLSVIEN